MLTTMFLLSMLFAVDEPPENVKEWIAKCEQMRVNRIGRYEDRLTTTKIYIGRTSGNEQKTYIAQLKELEEDLAKCKTMNAGFFSDESPMPPKMSKGTVGYIGSMKIQEVIDETSANVEITVIERLPNFFGQRKVAVLMKGVETKGWSIGSDVLINRNFEVTDVVRNQKGLNVFVVVPFDAEKWKEFTKPPKAKP